MPIGKPASEVGDHTVGHLSPNLALSPAKEWQKEGYFGAARGCVGMGAGGAESPVPNWDGDVGGVAVDLQVGSGCDASL